MSATAPYFFFAEYLGTRLFAQSSQTGTLSGLQFSQNFWGPIQVNVRDMTGNAADMTGFAASCGIVGVDGNPVGTPGGKALAEFTTALTLDVGGAFYTGVMDCRTAAMATLIGTASSRRSSFGIRFLSSTQEFECSADCNVLAQRIPAIVTAPASIAPIAFTVLAGQSQATFNAPNMPVNAYLEFVKLSSGNTPVDFYVVNVNPDNPGLNTVTVTLVGNAVTDMNFVALYVGP